MTYEIYLKDSNGQYNPRYITKLLQNYRSDPSIIQVSNKLFYDNDLIPMVQTDENRKFFPVIFFGVEGKEERVSYSTR